MPQGLYRKFHHAFPDFPQFDKIVRSVENVADFLESIKELLLQHGRHGIFLRVEVKVDGMAFYVSEFLLFDIIGIVVERLVGKCTFVLQHLFSYILAEGLACLVLLDVDTQEVVVHKHTELRQFEVMAAKPAFVISAEISGNYLQDAV